MVSDSVTESFVDWPSYHPDLKVDRFNSYGSSTLKVRLSTVILSSIIDIGIESPTIGVVQEIVEEKFSYVSVSEL
mgnify:CR=1 FL=1